MSNMQTMRQALKRRGFIIGKRDLRINTDFPGAFMVSEPYDESELPTKDGASGPWAVVGDNLDSLIEAAYQFAVDWGRGRMKAQWEYRTDNDWPRYVLVYDGVDLLGRVVENGTGAWGWHVFDENGVTRWYGEAATRKVAQKAVESVVKQEGRARPRKPGKARP